MDLGTLGTAIPDLPDWLWLAWLPVAFLAGSLPWSVWIGAIVSRQDIRQLGDGNPGAANAFKAGKWEAFVPAMLLDGLKGAIPVGIALWGFGITGLPIALIAIAPVAGHAWSPFLGFRGGKALAVTFGVWFGLMPIEGAVVLGVCFVLALLLLASDAWAVLLAMLFFLAYLLVRGIDPAWYVTWAGCFGILLIKHWASLQASPLRLRWPRSRAAGAP